MDTQCPDCYEYLSGTGTFLTCRHALCYKCLAKMIGTTIIHDKKQNHVVFTFVNKGEGPVVPEADNMSDGGLWSSLEDQRSGFKEGKLNLSLTHVPGCKNKLRAWPDFSISSAASDLLVSLACMRCEDTLF